MGGHVARMGDRRGAYRGLAGRPDEKRPLRSTGRRWKNNSKMNLQRSGWGVMDWIAVAQ